MANHTFHACFQSWMVNQEEEMCQLMQAIKEDAKDNEKLCQLVEICIKHYEEYHQKRLVHARSNPSLFFTPTWCTSFENTHLWIGGCRPTLFIQLIYTLCGMNIESELSEFLHGVKKGNLGELSAEQLSLVNHLHVKTIRDEDKQSRKIAAMQESMGNKTLVQMATEWDPDKQGESSSAEYNFLDSYELGLVGFLEEADKLRLKTLQELLNILTPLQAVEFLMAAKKLHLSIHNWCKKRIK
ncbi:Transcription factor [Thalictrum thalictroides]|uniref:Transcription factor n=1 Tax=Thalictrum thalictroides TaxID=46969 RepID=A0A7J6W474_THATH|nr:Transcription factor [Thalictrum thalictroides]